MFRTQGEMLFNELNSEEFFRTSSSRYDWNPARQYLQSVGGSKVFAGYFQGAIAIHAQLRLLHFWDHERTSSVNVDTQVSKIYSFLLDEINPSLEKSFAQKVARLVISASAQTRREISPSERTLMLDGKSIHTCYLCGNGIDSRIKDQTAPGHLTAEHVWPRSFGGDSVSENLLPACVYCQNSKSDSASWEWSQIHTLVFPVALSNNDLTSLSRNTKVARHYLRTLETCRQMRLSLKEGFLKEGPMKTPTFQSTGLPVTFYNLVV